MANRKILYDSDYTSLVEELAEGAAFGPRGLIVGNIEGLRHARHRTSNAALWLMHGLGRAGLIRPQAAIEPIGAAVQDKVAFKGGRSISNQVGFQGFQAAHVLPCDFSVNGQDGVHEIFRSPIIRGNVKLKMFGRTKILHKLANYADRRCEANGWIRTFHESICAVLAGTDPEAAYRTALVPGYIRAVEEARRKLLDALTQAEGDRVGIPPLFDANGNQATPRTQDFRVGKSVNDPDVLAANKTVVLQVFDEYQRGDAGLAPSELTAARRESEAYVELELDWRRTHG